MAPDERARAAEPTPEDVERARQLFRRDTLPAMRDLLDAAPDEDEDDGPIVPPAPTKPARPRGGRRR